jgi:hypothetical protein
VGSGLCHVEQTAGFEVCMVTLCMLFVVRSRCCRINAYRPHLSTICLLVVPGVAWGFVQLSLCCIT